MGKDEEDRGRRPVNDRDKDVLARIDALQALVQEDPEQPDQQDALRRAEVATVDGGQEHAGEQDGPAVLSSLLAVSSDPRGQARLQHYERARGDDQRGNDNLEDAGGQGKQRRGTRNRSGPRRDAEPDQPAALAGQLLPVSERSADIPWHKADVV